jgi:hypothetical protein
LMRLKHSMVLSTNSSPVAKGVSGLHHRVQPPVSQGRRLGNPSFCRLRS